MYSSFFFFFFLQRNQSILSDTKSTDFNTAMSQNLNTKFILLNIPFQPMQIVTQMKNTFNNVTG